jgi:hypothetical protein
MTRLPEEEANSRPALSLDCQPTREGSARLPAALVGRRAGGCFIARDANGQALAYVDFEDEPGRRSAAHLLTVTKVRRIAANIAKLPERK